MEAIGPPFDNFDLVIDPFQPPGMNRILAVIQNSIAVALQGCGEPSYRGMIHRLGQTTPFIDGFIGPCPGPAGPDMFEFVFEDQDRVHDLVQAEKLSPQLPTSAFARDSCPRKISAGFSLCGLLGPKPPRHSRSPEPQSVSDAPCGWRLRRWPGYEGLDSRLARTLLPETSCR